jgi:transposase InsO family protein
MTSARPCGCDVFLKIDARVRWRQPGDVGQVLEHAELAPAERVDWWNQRRLHGATDNLPPAESERRWWERAGA